MLETRRAVQSTCITAAARSSFTPGPPDFSPPHYSDLRITPTLEQYTPNPAEVSLIASMNDPDTTVALGGIRSASQRVSAISELRMMILHFLFDKDAPVALEAPALLPFRTVNSHWRQSFKDLISSVQVRDILFTEPGDPEEFPQYSLWPYDDAGGDALRFSPTAFPSTMNINVIDRPPFRLNPVLKEILPLTYFLQPTIISVGWGLLRDIGAPCCTVKVIVEDLCVHGDGYCHLYFELSYPIELDFDYQFPDLTNEFRLSPVHLIPLRNLYLTKPALQTVYIQFVSARHDGCLETELHSCITLECSKGVRVGHLLVALADKHAHARFGGTGEGYVFDDQNVIHVDAVDGERYTAANIEFSRRWADRMGEIESSDMSFWVWKVSGLNTWEMSKGHGVQAGSEREGLVGIGMGWMNSFLCGVERENSVWRDQDSD